MRLKLHQKISLGICVIVVSLMTLVMTIGNLSTTNAVEWKIHDDLLRAEEVFKYFQATRFRDLLTASKIVADIPQLRVVITTPDIDHNTILDTAKSTQEIVKSDLFIITDASGKLLASTTEPQRYKDDLLSDPVFRDALYDGKSYTGFKINNQGVFQVAICPILFDKDVMGSLLLGYAINQAVLNSLARMTNSEIALVTPNFVLSSSSANPRLTELQRNIWKDIVKNHSTDQLRIDKIGNERYLYLTFPISSEINDGFYILARSLDEELFFFHQLQQKLLIAGIFMLLAALLFGLFYSRKIVEPIQALVMGIRRVAMGDLKYRVSIPLQDEIGQLANSFNKMADDLNAYMINEKKLAAEAAIAESEKKRADDLAREKAKTELILNTAEEGIFGLDIDGQITFINPAALRIFDIQFDNVIGKKYHPLFHYKRADGTDYPAQGSPIYKSIKNGNAYRVDDEVFWKKDGTHFPVEYSSAPIRKDGRLDGAVVTFSDITLRKRIEDQLVYEAFHDVLTGLPNRALLIDRLERLIARARRHPNYMFAVLFIDLDRFKIINDSLGHVIGDHILVEVSKRLRESLRTSDTIARLGGDEFVLVLEEVDNIKKAIFVAERIKEKLTPPFQVENHELFLTASIGIVFSKTGYTKPAEFLRDADNAMYRAKNSGKAKYQVFDETMHSHALTTLQKEADLRRAVEKKEFIIHYQPILSLHTDKVVRIEALIRWQHPQRGIIPPLDFIPLAEETGLIIPIGEWLLETVCEQSLEWKQKGYRPVNVAINFSALQFYKKNISTVIKRIIKRTQVDALTLEIEITESVAMRDVNFTVMALHELHKMGIQISIDDFGTGYASLNCLKFFPINSLKIDRDFIQELPNNSANKTITEAIVMLAHNLGFKVVAEGVETQEQLDFLRQIKCDEAQGYFFSRPVPAEEIAKMLK